MSDSHANAELSQGQFAFSFNSDSFKIIQDDQFLSLTFINKDALCLAVHRIKSMMMLLQNLQAKDAVQRLLSKKMRKNNHLLKNKILAAQPPPLRKKKRLHVVQPR